MKFSIRSRLILAVSGLIIFFVFMSWFLNSSFLVDYYYLNKENNLRNYHKQINELFEGNPSEILLNLERIERTEGLTIMIQDQSFNTLYSSYMRKEFNFVIPIIPRISESLPHNPGSPESLIIEKSSRVLKNEVVVEKSNDRRLNSDFLNLVGLLDNKYYIFLSTPVMAIQESAQIANKFFLVTGLFTLLIGMIFVFIFARRFTKPILDLKEIAQDMSKLDFSKKYPVLRHDEIGELGISLNSLSEQLEKAILELRQANEKLMEDIERERKIDNMRKEFISSVSHELKTPIALIQGYAEGLKVNVNEAEEDKDFYCEVIMDEAGKMNRLVKQLLDLSQIDSGYTRLERTDFDLTILIEHVLKKNALVIRENKITVETEMESGLMVNADIDRIEQVLVNFLVNAFNHVDYRNLIKVKVQKIEDKERGTKARVTIFNSGPHIPTESLDKIWTSFYKVDQARTRAYGGTGLGLAIVKSIQDLHQNSYGVNNTDGGVEFWFEIDL
ncbi:MAG: histidine kinase [Gracilibacter sp. BRH_c7a]|nr:MAG: histidine kinase [Gracilibacter sp. BRH_c7a]